LKDRLNGIVEDNVKSDSGSEAMLWTFSFYISGCVIN